jgi:toxin CcdB
MPQFDVFRTADGELLLDCQSEALGYLATRMTAPLLPIERAPERRVRLNPVFEIGGESYVMVTQFAAAVSSKDLRAKVTNLGTYRFDVIGAFDMLLTGV